MSPPSVAEYWLPSGVNPPCTCDSHHHRADDEGRCEYPTSNDPQGWGYCACQHNAFAPVTHEKYQRWQDDIARGRIGRDDKPDDLGIEY